MPVLELETPEAKYIIDMSGDEHFAIDCACKGKDGDYHGSHYKKVHEIFDEITRDYKSIRMNKSEHTYLLSEILLLDELKHLERMKTSPLIIICNDCGREFPFTFESYWELKQRMMRKYNEKCFETQGEFHARIGEEFDN